MKEGILHEQKGKIFPYDAYAATLYGFNNGYCALCRVAVGGPAPTPRGEKPDEMIELTFSGMTVLPEDLHKLTNSDVGSLYDSMTDVEVDSIMKKIAEERKESDMNGVNPINKYNAETNAFEKLNHMEMVKILRDLKEMPQRQRIKGTPLQLYGCIEQSKREKYFPKRDGEEK